MDIDVWNRADWERRRKIRLTQVRNQSKEIAKKIRERIYSANTTQLERHEMTKSKSEHKYKSLALDKLKSDFNYLIKDVGNGYSTASVQSDPNIILAEKRLINRCKAISRGVEAEKRKKQLLEEQNMDKEMKERRIHFNKTIEKIRSTIIANVDSSNNLIHTNRNHNECFLIPSQVPLNESNIMNFNYYKKTLKPWSTVFNSKENETKFFQSRLNDNKENIPNETKLSKLENDVKNYETLVEELQKLSTEELSIRNKLFPNNKMNISVPNYNIPISHKGDKHKEITKVKHKIKDCKQLNEIKSKDIGMKHDESSSSSSLFVSSSSTLTISNELSTKFTRKTIHFEDKTYKNNIDQSSYKTSNQKKSTPEKPMRNINNMLQRIKKKKQLLAKEISTNSNDIKKPKIISAIETVSTNKMCAAINSCIVSPINYAKLPDTFYNNQLETLKEQISKHKSHFNNSKCTKPINTDLIRYINILLKMTPSDVDNLSTSSCSSIKLEENVIKCSKKDTQYYCKMLNCISKCLNIDISDISQDSIFDSPKNINLLNKLQELTNFYSEKTVEMKNICDESFKLKGENIDTKIKTSEAKNVINVSSDSSADGEYIVRHLNTLLQNKGLISLDKEWPVFENLSSDNDDRSLTDQLLDVNPRRSVS